MKNIFNQIIIWIVRLYQIVLSPTLGQNCRFNPTCSQYTIDCFKEHSFIKALFFSLLRILKCHPFNKGGYDPVTRKGCL